ncbi:MAG: hypothetical protein IID43_02860 [Planctomycetes bacterium]|nr:hypothetical protein [Planctomycetota bacterium]
MSETELIAFHEWLTTVAWHVHDLVRLPAGLERFQENIWRWYLHVKIRNSEMKGWEIRRDEHIDTVLASPRLRDKAAGPPRYLGVKFLASQPEWEWWETTRPIHVEWRIMGVAGWAPPDLNYNEYLAQFVATEVYEQWQALWLDWSLRFPVYHDFIIRYPDSDKVPYAREQLLDLLVDDIYRIQDRARYQPDIREKSESLLRPLFTYLTAEFPDAIPADLQSEARTY